MGLCCTRYKEHDAEDWKQKLSHDASSVHRSSVITRHSLMEEVNLLLDQSNTHPQVFTETFHDVTFSEDESTKERKVRELTLDEILQFDDDFRVWSLQTSENIHAFELQIADMSLPDSCQRILAKIDTKREEEDSPLFLKMLDKYTQHISASVKEIYVEMGKFDFRAPPQGVDPAKVEMKDLVGLKHGVKYLGEWNISGELAVKEGMGIQIWPNGSLYIGWWKQNKANGWGRLISQQGDVYEGTWEDDKGSGVGLYIHQNGSIYVGQFLNDRQHGIGQEKWPDGVNYFGQYENGRKCGVGRMKWADGTSYQGQFRSNRMEGLGRYDWADGRSYMGEWKGNKMYGRGHYTWPDKREYLGEYYQEKKEGFGRFVWPDKRAYVGHWRDGMQNGIGIYVSGNGGRKPGFWKDGKREKWLEEVAN